MPLQLRNKSDFIPELTMPNVSELNPFNTHSFLLQSVGVPAQIQTLGHQSPKLKSSMADQNQAVQVNLIPLRSIRYYFFYSHLRFLSVSDDPLCLFRLIQWNPAPTPAANPALPDDSSESYNNSPSRYDERVALRFKAERDETRRELEDVSKKAGIAELEWEHQHKQLLETIDGKFLD
jgi:hypothetical protein